MKICVATASGIEAVTKREIYKLTGKDDLSAVNGRITIDGGFEEISLLNLRLRTGNRVGIVLGEFKAGDFDSLFGELKEIPFEDIIPSDGKIIISAKSVKSTLFAYSAIQSVAKKAICERLCGKYGLNTLPESGEEYRIEISIFKDFATVILDTTGEGLHRRGYRGLVGEAPLKETLASALIDLSVWKPDRPFADLFCGSGTIAIEAAMKGINAASGKSRSFDFYEWKVYDKKILDKMKEEAEAEEKKDADLRIYAFDIDEKQISLARTHARLAGVEKYIHFQRADMRDFSSRFSHGVIISNPPYGERLSDRKGVETLYRDFGKKFRSLDEWCAYVLTSVGDFERLFGGKADKKRKLYNGNIECNYYSFLGAPPAVKRVDNKKSEKTL